MEKSLCDNGLLQGSIPPAPARTQSTGACRQRIVSKRLLAEGLEGFLDVSGVRAPRFSEKLSRSIGIALDLDGAQLAACLIAASNAFASKAGMLWIRPRPWVEYQTENARSASGLGASTMSTKS